MGNRAVITNGDIDIYVHWNGGYDSVTAFLRYCELRKFRTDGYGIARLTQIIANYFGGDLSIGITAHGSIKHGDLDNGTYYIKNWKIVKQDPGCWNDEHDENFNIVAMLIDIDKCQPEADRLGEEYIRRKVKG